MRARAARSVLAMALVATAGALGFALLWAGGAQAAPAGGSCGTVGKPPCSSVTVNDTETSGTITIAWTASGLLVDPPPLPTLTWAPSVSPLPVGAPSPPTPGAVELADPSCTAPLSATMTCTYSWPAGLLDSGFVLNGTYTLNAAASCAADLGCSPGTLSQPVMVDNAPMTPTDVQAAIVPNSAAVKISWAPDPEPDIVGYQVFRSDGSFACQLPTTPPPTAYDCIDSPTTDGSYAYHVVAYRWTPSYSDAVKNLAASGPSTATKALTVTGTSTNSTSTTVAGSAPLGPAGFAATPSPNKDAKSGTGSGTFSATPSAAVVAPATATTVDPGFDATLPYGTTVPPNPGTNPAAIAPPSIHKGSNSVGTIAAIGAGLLIAVIALHGLWLRAEVRRSGALEVLEPEH